LVASSQVFQTALGVAKETTYGTGVAPTAWLPISNPRFQPQALRNILDNGFRGQPAVDFDLIAGPGEGTLSFDGIVFPDSFPNLLMNVFGNDAGNGTLGGAYTPSAGTPYSHKMSVLATPPSHTFEWQQGVQTYWFQGARVSSLTLNFNARDGALTYSCQAIGKLGTTHASTATAFTTTGGLPGWACTFKVAGSPVARLLEGSITFARAQRPLHVMNATQDVNTIYPLGLQVTARLTFDYQVTTEWLHFTQNPPDQTLIEFVFANGGFGPDILMTKGGWRMVDIEVNDNINTAVAQINGIYNATDLGPCQVNAISSQSTSY
jgi:hypothetical protein